MLYLLCLLYLVCFVRTPGAHVRLNIDTVAELYILEAHTTPPYVMVFPDSQQQNFYEFMQRYTEVQ